MTSMRVRKTFSFEGAHKLNLPYESKCNRLHGHRWEVIVELKGEVMEDGMVVDFSHISKIRDELDHRYLNEIVDPPTAEKIAEYIAKRVLEICNGRRVYSLKVEVKESKNNTVIYEVDSES